MAGFALDAAVAWPRRADGGAEHREADTWWCAHWLWPRGVGRVREGVAWCTRVRARARHSQRTAALSCTSTAAQRGRDDCELRSAVARLEHSRTLPSSSAVCGSCACAQAPMKPGLRHGGARKAEGLRVTAAVTLGSCTRERVEDPTASTALHTKITRRATEGSAAKEPTGAARRRKGRSRVEARPWRVGVVQGARQRRCRRSGVPAW